MTEEPSWEALGLSKEALALIAKADYRSPTPVQAATIPAGLKGRDVVASAQTGTGKTASFVLPMVDRLAGRNGTYALILAPTRELAQQTAQTIEIFGGPRGVKCAVLIGGIDMRHDEVALATHPQIIVATPGRLCDHLERGNIWLDFVEMVVLDEADRMLDMGFADQLSKIMASVPQDRQTLLFSATIPPAVESLARRILHDPERVTIGRPQGAAKTVEQRLIWVTEQNHRRELLRALESVPGTTIIFVRSKINATKLWNYFRAVGVYDATFIHSDRLQSQREQALADFKAGKYRILIATDVAGRGLHVDKVAHVINFELPLDPEDYVHRIGRTGRSEELGIATSFVTPRDTRLLRQIEKLLGHEVPAMNAPQASRGGEDEGRGGGRPSRRGGRGGRSGRGGGHGRGRP